MGDETQKKQVKKPTQLSSAKTTADTLRKIADGIESGQISDYEITQTGKGFVNFMIDSSDGQDRLIQQHKVIKGVSRKTIETISKQTKDDRLDTVRELFNEGMTQEEIAKRTMTSQKTVSNDLKILREEGLIEE
jgi:DNA-binding NarL/FixJ family response regulator